MKKRRKGQSTIEFTILISFMILMFSVFFVLVGQKLVDLRSERNYEIANTIKDLVNNEFQLAKIVEIGYTRQFKLPGSIEGMDYQINITNSTELNIYVGQAQIHSRLPDNVSGNISKGWNNVTKKDKLILIEPVIIDTCGCGECRHCDASKSCVADTDGKSCSIGVCASGVCTAACGTVSCQTPTPYYYDWIGDTCYYKADAASTCQPASEVCPAQGQGASTGVTRAVCKDKAGCTGTTAPTTPNIASGADNYNDCGILSCAGYYYGWVGDYCYLTSWVMNNDCNGTGSCKTQAQACTISSGNIASISTRGAWSAEEDLCEYPPDTCPGNNIYSAYACQPDDEFTCTDINDFEDNCDYDYESYWSASTLTCTPTQRKLCHSTAGCTGTTAPSTLPVSTGDDPYDDCGGLSCAGYYYGWSGNTCYLSSNVLDNNCNGAGTCKTAAQSCPAGQGLSSGVTCASAALIVPGTCQGTTPGSCLSCTPGASCGFCKSYDASCNCVNNADGTDPHSECGALSCTSPTAYYWGWVLPQGSTAYYCYYRAIVPSNTCNGFGACRTQAQACPLQGKGTASGALCWIIKTKGGCVGTTPPTCT